MKAQRIVTGIAITTLYIAVIALCLHVHPIFFDVFIFMIAMAGAYEMNRALPQIVGKPVMGLALPEIVLGFAAFWFSQYYFRAYAAGMTAFFIVLALMVIVTVIVTSASKKLVKSNAIATIFVMLYPCALLMFHVGLNYFIDLDMGLAGSSPFRNAGICMLFLVSSFTDMFAYFVGSRIGGKKLCPEISPNKTVAGAVGGLIGGVVAGGVAILLIFMNESLTWHFMNLALLPGGWTQTIVTLLVLGLFGSLFTQLGDLFASLIKRRSGLKDYSNLLPGHGGVLDRVDGFIFCGVLFYLVFAVMVLL